MTLTRSLQLTALFLLTACSNVGSALEPAVPKAPEYTLSPNNGLGAGQPDTVCRNVQVKRKTVGVYCRSSSAALLQELGVSVTPAGSSDAGSARNVDFATGMSQYSGTPRKLNGRDGFTAEVDCDTGTGEVYRATGTCLAAVSFDDSSRFHYTQLTLRDDAAGKQVLSPDDALAIADALD
jgi:hypothetical protein